MINSKKRINKWVLVAACLIPLSYASYSVADDDDDDDDREESSRVNSQLTYEVKASMPCLNRRVTGEVISYLDGVPAEPVDSFVWDGVGSVPVKGSAKLEIDPVANTGEIWAEWEDRNGS
ncbi:MAG: hypothetical protein COB30_000665 [Ectothiorhodospiraceae bacterium]|nr:hypothetical protein [Ectothiorhodospiraceae bacterium]